MRRTFLVSFLVSFVMLGVAVVGASLHKLPPVTDSAAGSTGHTLLTETNGTGCVNCHSGAGITASFTTTADAAVTATQLYPGEGAAFRIKAAATSTFAGGPHNWMGANIAATGGTLTENELALVVTNGEIQHSSTVGYLLNTVPAGGSNFYTFFYTLTNPVIPATNTIAGVSCVGFPGSGQHAPSITVTSRRPADPASLSAGTSNSNSIPLSWSSSSPLNRIIAKTGTFATAPTDTTGTIVYEGPSTTTTITGLSPVMTYFFKVWGESSYSGINTYSTNGATTSAATTSVGPPPAATGLTVTNVTGSTMDVSWRGSSPAFRAIYKAGSVPISPTDGTLITPEGATTLGTATGLSPNTRYFIAVYGKDAAAATPYSPTAATTSVITGPTALIASDGAGPGLTSWERRSSPTRLGKFIYTNGTDVRLYDGSSASTLQAGSNPNTVFTVGTAADPTKVMAAWRSADAFVWSEGGSIVQINAANPVQAGTRMDAEVITIDGGCVFVTFRATNGTTDIRNAFRVDPTTGNATNLTNNLTHYGVVHMSSSGCTAAWAFVNGSVGNPPYDLQYYNGTSVATIDTALAGDPSVGQGGRVVYAKTVAPGRAEIFLYDPSASPTPVQLTNDVNYTNETPFTDGRHAAWVRKNVAGTVVPEIVLNGGVQVTSGNFAILDNAAAPAFDLDRGQILWRDTTGALHHLTSVSNDIVDRATAANTSIPWLADGRVVFFDSTANPQTIYRFIGQLPNDAQQPSPPMTLRSTAGSGSVSLTWDAILGATSYNVYYAAQPGLTKANYASLGGTRIMGITSPSFTVTGLTPNTPYYFVVTTVAATGEGPESRQASTVLIGTPTWTSVGGLTGTNMTAVAADRTNGNSAYASGGNNPFNTYASTDGGQTWSVLGGGIGGVDVRALAANAGSVFAASRAGSIYRSMNGGAAWSGVAAGTSGKFQQAIAIDPAIPTTIVAGDFRLASFSGGLFDSDMIRSDDNGATWFHLPQYTPSGSLVAYSLAFDPNRSSILFVGGNGTPNVAKSIAGGAGWANTGLPTSASMTGYVYAVAVDPQNSQTIYAGTQTSFGGFFPGVWKSTNAGTTWTQLTTGLPTSTPVHAIIVDPADSNVIHLGTELGYYDSTNAGASWTLLNGGLLGGAQFISSLAMTGSHRLIAATGDGLYVLNLAPAPAPSVISLNPTSGNVAGGTSVTITGSNFVSGVTVTFGGAAATNVSFGNSTTISATTPAHAGGAVDVVVRNPDGQTGTLTSGFTYNISLAAPTGVNAMAVSTTQVNVSWNAVGGATSYQVYRRAGGGGYILLSPSPATNAFTDTGVTGGNSYQYLVRATNVSTSSTDSVPDIATTILFTDDPIVAGSTIVKAVHLTELRNATNAVRFLGSQGAFTFTTGGAAGTAVTAAQINELRSALDVGLNALLLPFGGYTDTLTAGVPIKAVHFQEIRNRVK